MTEEKLDKIMAMLMGVSHTLEEQEKRIDSLENKPKEKNVTNKSPREFFLLYLPKKDTDKTLVAIHFLDLKGITQITSKDIAGIFADMREEVPKNIADKIQLLDKRGFLIKSEEKKGGLNCWGISQSGSNHLEELKNVKNK